MPRRGLEVSFLTPRHCLCRHVCAHVCTRACGAGAGRAGSTCPVCAGAAVGVGVRVLTEVGLWVWVCGAVNQQELWAQWPMGLGAPGWAPEPEQVLPGPQRAVLTLSLARGRGLLGAGVLDEHVVLVVGAALLAHLHHLHLGQCRVPLHHVLGPQGHQAADLQLAPTGTERRRPGEPAAPQPRASPDAPSQHISSARHLTAQHNTSGRNQARQGREPSLRQKHQAPSPQPQIQNQVPPKPPSPYLWLAGLRKETRRRERWLLLPSDFYRE